MKLMLGNLEIALATLNAVAGEKISVATRFNVKKTLATLGAEYERFTESRIELCKKYCKRDGQNNPVIEKNSYQFEDDKFEEFQKDLSELQAVAIDFLIKPFTLKDFGSVSIDPELSNALIELGFVVEGE